MASIVILGRLGADPEEVATSSGTLMVKFAVAEAAGKDKEGNEQTSWWNVVAFGQDAERVQKFFKKGSLINLRGEATCVARTLDDGTKRKDTNVKMEGFSFVSGLGGKAKSDDESESSAAEAKQSTSVSEYKRTALDTDDVPF